MAKPDNRKNNVERLQQMVKNTEENMEAAKEIMENEGLTLSEKHEIEVKNHHREESVESFKEEIAEEQADRELGKI